jgi:glycosyltransferase involved in cell wall biosynthesis
MSHGTTRATNDHQRNAPASLSIVVPVFNEQDNLVPLHEQIGAVLDQLGRDAEIVFVDDGSSDGSLAVLRRLQQSDPRVKIVVLRRNFGQTAAMAAGFHYARADLIIVMDADLQNDPADIPALLAKHDEGYDVVSGWRKQRKDPWLSRRLPSQIANCLISCVTGVHLHDYGCTLKLYTRDTIDDLQLYGEMHRFIPALASWRGSTIAEVPVNHHRRLHGKSKYGISRTVRVILDLLTVKFLLQYSTKPLHIFGLWGLLVGFAGFVIAAYLTVLKLGFHQDIGHRPALLLAVLLMVGGLQLITMGLLAELQVRTLHEARRVPVYVVKESLGIGLDTDAQQADTGPAQPAASRRPDADPERSDAV